MIRVYPSPLPGQPIETHNVSGITLCQWMRENVNDYKPGDNQPVSASVFGEIIAPGRWDQYVIDPVAPVDICLMPRGAGVAIGLGTLGLVGDALKPILASLAPDIPSPIPQGQQLDAAALRANTARLGGIVPEVFGNVRHYPDYLVPPRRYFQDERTQVLECLFCVGKGTFEIPVSSILIGDTPLQNLGANAEFDTYNPDSDLSSDPRAEWWHTVEEVGGTATGGSGLELPTTFSGQLFPSATAFEFDDDTITVPSGAGDGFPEAWDDVEEIRVELYRDYVITSGGTRDIISGELAELGAFSGMAIEIVGDNDGDYLIETYTPASVDDPGSASTLTGSAAPATYDYDASPVSFDVELGAASQTISLNTDVVNFAGLITEINSQLDATVQADDASGSVRLTEQGPDYSGETLTVTGDFQDVFGATPVEVVGDETTEAADAEITLSYDNGSPVTGLTAFTGRMAIGYRGMRYRLLTRTDSEITIDRLTDTGSVDGSWPGFTATTETDAVIEALTGDIEEGVGPFAVCPAGEVTDSVEVDVFFPIGLYRVSSEGKIKSQSQQVFIEYREIGSGDPWTEISESWTRSSVDQIGFTIPISLGAPQRIEVRARAGGSSTNSRKLDVVLYGIRSKLTAPTSYPWTTLAVRITGGNQVSAQSENKISVQGTRRLPVLDDGSWGAESATRDIAPVVRYITNSMGLPDTEIDIDALEELAAIWGGRGDTFDYVFSQTTVRAAIDTVLRAGMAELTLEEGIITPIREGVRSSYESSQGFSAQNIVGDLSRTFASRRPDDTDGVDVEYIDRVTWNRAVVQCRLPGDAGNKAEKIKIDGVTTRTKAWQIGMRRRAALRYQRWQYSFQTELDGLNARYKMFVPIISDVPEYGQSSIMRAITDEGGGLYRIRSGESMAWQDGESHVFAFRRPDGTVAGPWAATRGDNDYEILASVTPADVPDLTISQEPPHIYFGTIDKWTFPALVTEITPQGRDKVRLNCVNYDERIYQYDDDSPD